MDLHEGARKADETVRACESVKRELTYFTGAARQSLASHQKRKERPWGLNHSGTPPLCFPATNTIRNTYLDSKESRTKQPLSSNAVKKCH